MFSNLSLKDQRKKNPANPSGCTPLHWAALRGDPDLCKLIIDKLEDKNNVHGYTPLHLAANIGNLKVAKLIREEGGQNVHWTHYFKWLRIAIFLFTFIADIVSAIMLPKYWKIILGIPTLLLFFELYTFKYW